MRLSTDQIPTSPRGLCTTALLGSILVAYGLPEPQFEATQGGIATGHSALGKRELSAALGHTVPNQLNSRLQQYRLKNAKRLTRANTATTPTISEIIQ